MKTASEPPADLREPGCWIVTADHRAARLLRAARTPHGRLHLEPCSELEEHWEGLEHARPSPRAAKDGHSYASLGHEDEEREQRFAKAVVAWLERETERHRILELHAFTGPHFLGRLRRVLPTRLQHRTVAHPVNLAHLSAGELARHEAIVAAHESASAGRSQDVEPGPGLSAGRAHRTAVQLALEHAAVRNAVQELTGELERLRREPGPVHRVGRLDGMLSMFRHHLTRHFELEEREGYLCERGGEGRDRREAIERCRAQHRSFEERLAALHDGVARAEEAQSGLSDAFVEGLADFLEELMRHESSENALLLDLVLDETPSTA